MIEDWLYLVKRCDHMKYHEDIYKIDQINDFNTRINEYSYVTQIIYVCPIDNDKTCGHKLIYKFKSEFDWCNYAEREYFARDERDTIPAFNDYCSNHLLNRDEEVDMD
jgi:hypothetical protein